MILIVFFHKIFGIFPKDSFYEIDELKLMVKKLLNENCQLKSRIDSTIATDDAFDVAL